MCSDAHVMLYAQMCQAQSVAKHRYSYALLTWWKEVEIAVPLERWPRKHLIRRLHCALQNMQSE
jgi:hypothetical protein